MSIVSILTSPSDRRTPADRGRTAASSADDCGIGRAYFPDVSPTAGVFDAEHVADLWSSAKLGPFCSSAAKRLYRPALQPAVCTMCVRRGRPSLSIRCPPTTVAILRRGSSRTASCLYLQLVL